MEVIKDQQHTNSPESSNNSIGRITIGVVCILIGLVWAGRKAGLELPEWVFSWGTILTTIGVISGVLQKFKMGAWIIPLILGIIFLVDEFYPLTELWKYVLPVLLMVIGIVIIWKPGK